MQGGEGQIITEQTEKNTDSEKIFGFVYASESLTAYLEERLEGWLWGVKLKALGNRLCCIATPPTAPFT